MARSLAASQVPSVESDYRNVIEWYEAQLERAAPPTGLLWEPVRIGPTWQYDNGWVLPAVTLGWRNLAWSGLHLQAPKGGPWTYTLEQARWILWHDSLDPDTGEFLFPTQVLQRLKGWGKDPIAAAASSTHICSEDALFDHWEGDRPVGRQIPNPFVQIVGVAQDQIKQNTFTLFPSLIPAETRRKYGVQIGKLDVWARGDEAHIAASTSSVMAIEGPRPTLVWRNETQNWNASNGGHELAGAIDGNVTKSADAVSRVVDICNAYRPGEDSVGQRAREAYEKTVGFHCPVHADHEDWPACQDCQPPQAADFGMLYDSLEAPPEAPLSVEDAPAVVTAIRGDSVWLSIKRILSSIKNTQNSASESRRKWYNQITAAEDAWADPKHIALASKRDQHLEDGDKVVLFADGSMTDDATGLVAVRVSDGFAQVLHVQQPKRGQRVNRDALNREVEAAFGRFRVVAFWFDPSHAKDDESVEEDNRFWWPMADTWHRLYGKRLKCWPVKTGPKTHSVAFDMAVRLNVQTFVQGCEQVETELREGKVAFAASAALTEHLRNCKRAPGQFGVSVRKDNRESRHKIDLAVCLIGALTLRRIYLLSQRTGTPGNGRVVALN